ncbi:hypothetical protein SDRG_13344 [Saprolegnia diclina VS20]|uniref:Pre-mRNA-splicing factor cwc2 n=1 Tax=Saprolegnia diclina (strain VS20) TaxID=1156394 RepID=T0PU36_SAPDV|nr:hypothetical protein SDRG_13344 [Saprolegnia diclina VS20]EQC29009.1 hypothetical protein SDRG_13344 [Saprolegnia diclina VS20]|eukprot:XP_008617648.1 hypothetical protein SDRG_13344 [Saprolegnia diclina VS20]
MDGGGVKRPHDDESLPRKLTAVGVQGPTGAAYTVYEKNWHCKDCGQENYARRPRCMRCRAAKVAAPDALVYTAANHENKWREALDPSTQKIYYYHIETNATQWERPKEMGAAPHSTGWFGRGQAGIDNASKYEDLNTRLLQRPARKQIDAMPTKNTRMEGGNEYNIWYDKYVGENWDHTKGQDPAEHRCCVETDGGYTKADKIGKSNKFFCLHFARGGCARGTECNYFHRLPTMADELRLGMLHDCFGRERHATDRDDMAGAGNFMRNSRTLYVGGLKPKSMVTDIVMQAFEEWGEVENVNIVHRLTTAFVRYRHRTSAEFAKEAMSNQALEDSEILQIKWAMDDPNPVAKAAAQRADADAVHAMLKSRNVSTTAAPFDYPETYQMQTNKKQKALTDANMYPDTDTQFAATHHAAIEQQKQMKLLSYADQSDDEGEDNA